jgi:hypothetical protein
LTTAKLPKNAPNGGTKTEAFRNRITSFLRADPRWKPLIEALAWEDVAFGYTAAVWRDDVDFMPLALRQDSFYVPTGTHQHASTCPYFAFRHDMLPHEAFDLLQSVERSISVAASEGRQPAFTWLPDRLATAISESVREDSSAAASTTEEVRRLEDLRRQMSSGTTYGSGRKVVPLYHVYAYELTGRVSHFIVDKQYRLIFEWLDRFDAMERSCSFFAFELGDTSLHGSKGIGRLAYNVAGMLDRTTNDVIDRFHMSGKLFIKSPQARHRTFQATIRGGFCLLDPDYEVIPSIKIDTGVADSLSLDAFVGAKLDEMAGTTSPKQLEGERVTAAAVNLLASRESDRSDDFLGRWLPQVGDMVTEIVRRACLVNTDNPKALQLRNDLASDGLLPEDVEYLASQPAMPTLSGWTGVDRQNLIMACVEGRGNPVYDQRRIEEAKLEAQVGPEFASSVLAQIPDQIQLAEQQRQQTLENLALLQGQVIPVSLRDAHAVHLSALVPMIQGALQEAAANPASDSILEAFIVHARAHLSLAGTDPSVAEFEPLVGEMEKAFLQLQQAAAEAPPPVEVPAGEPLPPAVALEHALATAGGPI